MALAASTLEDLTLRITQQIEVNASPEATFDALLVEIGAANQAPDGTPLPMTIEARPGGRWYRDLGRDNGHLWGHVQAIKRPTLLEITGPLFMSYPVISNVQYRLSAAGGGTRVSFSHTALGLIPDDVRASLANGWTPLLDRIRRTAEKSAIA